MGSVVPNVASIVARTSGVQAVVRSKRDEVAADARALFASHNDPGRHEITTSNDGTDALVNLVGPAPLPVEYGRRGYVDTRGRHVGPMKGLRILGRAAERA